MRVYWAIGIGVLVVAIIAATTVYILDKRNGSKSNSRQAVFLTNGQVYFGYVDNPNDDVVKIKDIFYLKTQDLLNQTDTADEKKKISLVKLGNELHGPTDEMLINRNQILFIESMRDDSKINDAIQRFSSNKQETTTTP